VPAHVDCLLGAARPTRRLDGGGRLDRALGGRGSFRVRSIFHARRSLGRPGQQASGWDDLEETIGLSRCYAVELDDARREPAALERLRDHPLVESAGPARLATDLRAPPRSAGETARPSPTIEEAQIPFDLVRAPAAARREPGDESVRVAIVDTGVALGHPELRIRLLAGIDTVDLGMGALGNGVRLLGDTASRDFAPQDEVGHGSHVAGVVGAAGRRMPRGVGGRALMLPVRVLAAAITDRSGRPIGVGALSDIDAGLKLAVDLKARIVNLSLGTPVADSDAGGPPPHAAVARYADERGALLVAASGNDGTTTPFYPAALPSVLAVGSVSSAGDVSSFCSTGPHVVLHAPGEGIVSTGLYGYRRSTGTSHAAPFVAGAAALVVARADRAGVALRPSELSALLLATARCVRPGGPAVLDAEAALVALDARLAERAARTPERSRPWP
jgi:subtilisin family serine protease